MQWLKNITQLFFDKNLQHHSNPNITFGRYSDAYKTAEQYQYLDAAITAYNKSAYFEAYKAFLQYLADTDNANVRYTIIDGILHFTIIQGSKKIHGKANHQQIVAETDIVRYSSISVACMRKLLEINYQLNYCRFALNEQNKTILLKFDSSVIDSSPHKLYFALKELAIRADKQDDLLLASFKNILSPVDNDHVENIPIQEKKLKHQYFNTWISETIKEIQQLNTKIHAKDISYMLLNLAYKIDYLIVPQSHLKSKIERISAVYFHAKPDVAITDINKRIMREFKQMFNLSENTVYEEMYNAKATFGITNYTTPQQIITIIDETLPDLQSRQLAITAYILEYIAVYCMFHYGLPALLHQIMHFVIHIFNNDYFTDLGFENYYTPKGKLAQSRIKRTLLAIQEKGQQVYPRFKIQADKLVYDNEVTIVHSLYKQLKKANYEQ